MKKYKYFLVILAAAIIASGLFFPSVNYRLQAGKKIVKEVLQPDYSEEIKEVLVKFDSLYSSNVKQSGAVGGAVVITYKGQIVMIKCFGVKKAGENDKVDENTIFRLASVSKTITGVLAGILASENEINLDDKVADYIPGFRLNNQESTKNIRIKHLLSHTSGLIPHAFDMMVEDQVPLNQIITRLNEAEITSPPGLVYAYQNVMFSLIDPVIEAKMKKSFKSVLQEKVFDHFGMKNASVDFESFRNNENKAYPHQKREKGFSAEKLNNRYYSTAPAAGVNASISDMGRFLIAISGKNQDLFPDNARNIVFTPQVESPLKRSYYHNWGPIGPKYYAIGWRIINYKDRTIAHHSGYVEGYQSEIAICRENEIGIAVLTNSPNQGFSENVPAFLNLFFEHENKLTTENQSLSGSHESNP